MCSLVSKELLRFREYPFTFALSDAAAKARKSVTREREAGPCSSCGSVIVLGTKQASLARKGGRVFCDIECAGDFKRWHNRTTGYREQPAVRERREAAEARAKEADAKRWTCCVWCFRAYRQIHPSQVTCSSECRRRLHLLRLRQSRPTQEGDVVCVRCGKQQAVAKAASKRRFCSARCEKRAARERRVHWSRSNGPCEYIPLSRLVTKHDGRCVSCDCKVTRYSGEHRATDATIDHIVPLSKGGWHAWSNVQLMCHQCNSRKSDAIEASTPDGGVPHIWLTTGHDLSYAARSFSLLFFEGGCPWLR